MTLQRAAVVAVAVLAAGWLLVSYGNAQQRRDVQTLLSKRSVPPAALSRALRDIRSGQALDPSRGTERLAFEAFLETRLGRLDDARRTLDELARREPEIAETWALIADLNRTSDPVRAAHARAELRRLDPFETQRER